MKRSFLTGVGVIGITAALATTPAYAQDSEDSDTIALDARGTFDGFTAAPRFDDAIMMDRSHIIFPKFDATPVRPDPEIIARDDVGTDNTIDFGNTQPSVVQLFSQRNSDGAVFFNCTGTVINPRTILTAAHCLNARSSEAYGLPETGAERTVLVSTGVISAFRFFDYLDFGVGYSDGGVASSTDVVIHASSNLDNGGLPFPWADVALVALDEPITDVPAMPLLLSPLTELTHVVQVGYGSFGDASTGPTGISFFRRVGENMLGALASPADLGDAIFPGFAPTNRFGFESQVSYFTDFDNPFRTQEEIDGCTYSPGGISCESIAAARAIDYFEGDALPNEVATAGGDSGGPLIVDQLYDQQVIIGVLSGGFDFFGIGDGYGDISFYAPLFPFFEFISENTPYKYVSTTKDGGVWSDSSLWTQDLDPGFLIDDGSGNLVNALPEGSERGIYASDPKLGTILGSDINPNNTGLTPGIPVEGTPNFGANTPESSVLLGPGSTGFVPNNTDGTPGTAFANPAQYFDVLLTRKGTVEVDMDVEIDKLTIDTSDGRFKLPKEYDFTSIISVEQYRGTADIDGTLNTDAYFLVGGLLEGSGTINTNIVFNVFGGIAPGDLNKLGTLTIDGDYVQTSDGSLVVDARFQKNRNRSDLLDITGDASLNGFLFVDSKGKPSFGDEVTVLSANSILGEFDSTILLGESVTLNASSAVVGNDVVVTIGAAEIAGIVSADSNLQSLGAALDTIRFSGRYAQFANLFDIVDNAGFNAFLPTLSSLAPTSAFEQSTIATSFSNRFTGQIAQRTLALRGQGKAAGGFSAAGNAGFAIGGTAPQDSGKLGFFGSFSGSFLEEARTNRNTGAVAFQEATVSPAGEMTLGADLALTDNVSIGMAVTNIRNSTVSDGLSLQPEDSSVAGAAYGAVQLGNAFIDMHAGYARQTFGVERASVGDFTRAYTSAVGDAEGEQAFAGIRAGYAFDVADGLKMGPVASLDYVRTSMAGYTEFGAGEFGLDVRERNFTSLGSKIGAMASLDTGLGGSGKLTAFGSVAYARELADAQDIVTASFIGAPDAVFSIANALDPEWVSVNAGAELSLGGDLSLSLSGSSDFGRGPLTNQEGRVSFNWKF